MKEGFTLSDIFSRYFEMNSTTTTFGSATNVEEVIQKIYRIFPECETAKNLVGLKRKLLKSLRKEACDLGNNAFANLFLHAHRIRTFFLVLQSFRDGQKTAIDLDDLGYFDQLKCIEFCKNQEDLRAFVLRDSGIDNYFEDLNSEDLQIMYLKIMKSFYENAYQIEDATEAFREVIEEEAALHVLDAYMNMQKPGQRIPSSDGFKGNGDFEVRKTGACGFGSLSFDPRIKEIAPSVGGMDLILKKLEEARDISDIKGIFRLTELDILSGVLKRRFDIHTRSFDDFNNFCIVYSYFQLKEALINEIIYNASQSLNK